VLWLQLSRALVIFLYLLYRCPKITFRMEFICFNTFDFVRHFLHEDPFLRKPMKLDFNLMLGAGYTRSIQKIPIM
jgi:hypothetical protein